jgi:GNAT superfamily N-acetyltransferase
MDFMEAPLHIESLREIAFAAKAHWGYDRERVRAWADSIALDDGREIFVEDDAWASVFIRGEICWLEDLWVAPSAMGRGIGRRLFERAAGIGRERGCTRMEWDAEPNAVGFYERMGASHVRDGDVTEWGRVLPVMGVSLVE